MRREVKKGILHFDGCDTVDLVKNYGTPLYVVSETEIVRQIDELRECFLQKYEKTRVAYASKAFCTLAMYKLCEREGIGIDVVSGGELYTAIKAGFPAERIEFNGNNKLPEEIETAMEYGIGRFIIDGLQELEMIEKICKKKDKKVNVLYRITPGIAASSHDYIVTGKRDSKFGIPLDEEVFYPEIQRAILSEHVEFLGLHFHIGSQIMANDAYIKSIEVMLERVKGIYRRFGHVVKELNLGGGYGVSYTDEERKSFSYYLDPMVERIRKTYREINAELPAVVIEPGRSIVAEAGISLYTIGGIKEIKGVRKYVCVDGGMTDNIRPALYGARYDGMVANKADVEPKETVAICGKCCESGDVLIKDIKIAEGTEAGDIFAIFSTGAYGYSMACNYNNNPIPAVVLVKEGKSQIIVKRQTYDDIICNNVIPESLE